MLQRVTVGVSLALLVLACLNILRPFFSPLLWAVILTVTAWPVFVWMKNRLPGRPIVSAVFTSILIAIFCMIPVTYGVAVAAQSVKPLSQMMLDYSKEGLPPAPVWLKEYPYGGTLYQKWESFSQDRTQLMEDLSPLLKQGAKKLGQMAGKVGVGLLEFFFALIICGFFFAYGETLTRSGQQVLKKLFGPRGDELLEISARTIRSVMLGILGTAALQAALMCIGFSLAGVPQVVLLGFAGFFFASLQLSCGIVWVPVVIWLFLEGKTGWAVFNLIWGVGVVGLVDNFTKPYLISRGSNLPFGIIFLGVIGGFIAYGFLGIFFGATLMAVAFRLFKEWLAGESNERETVPVEVAGPIRRLSPRIRQKPS
jgi:predicted PurR-regulated permease PerM